MTAPRRIAEAGSSSRTCPQPATLVDVTGLTLPRVGDGTGLERTEGIHPEELQLALRNKAIPIEAVRYDVTPVGLHYTLIHYDIPAVDETEWELTIGGCVRNAKGFDLAALQRREVRTLRVTLECAGDGRALLHPRPLSQPWLTGAVGTAEWTGTPLRALLEEAGLEDDAVDVVFTGLDHGIEGGVEQDYQRALSRDEALRDDALLAWAMNGRPLEPQHGFPLRLVIPGWYGMAHVKWLRSIEAIATRFDGYQHRAYHYGETREPPGELVTLMRVRSLMVPPGHPDFLTRTRIVKRGEHRIEGKAWSGRAAIARVELSVDGGASWRDAEVSAPPSPHAWQTWSATWRAETVGPCELVCRAHDERGDVQPLEGYWTARGMGNNAAQRVPVIVV
jgi:sulfane dehydrogenase subunit SoxC